MACLRFRYFQNRLHARSYQEAEYAKHHRNGAHLNPVDRGVAACVGKEDRMKDLPPRSAGDKEQGAERCAASAKEVDKGKTLYEAELTVNGHSKDIMFDGRAQCERGEESAPRFSDPSRRTNGYREGTERQVSQSRS